MYTERISRKKNGKESFTNSTRDTLTVSKRTGWYFQLRITCCTYTSRFSPVIARPRPRVRSQRSNNYQSQRNIPTIFSKSRYFLRTFGWISRSTTFSNQKESRNKNCTGYKIFPELTYTENYQHKE